MLIAVDVGNSSLKVGVFEGDTLVSASRLASPGDEESLSTTLGLAETDVEAVVVVSVVRPALDAFLAGPGRGAVVLGRDLPILVPILCRRPEEIGLDRLVNAAAGHELLGTAAVVADLGSAATIDLVSEEGAFLGGSIAPGLLAHAAGLSEKAPALPHWDGESPGTGLPGTTVEAIRSGVVGGFAGAVDRLAVDVEAAGGADRGALPVLVTGGDAGMIVPYLPLRFRHVPHLTLSGVRLLYDRAGRA